MNSPRQDSYTPVGKYIELYREQCGTMPLLNNQEAEVLNRLVEWARSSGPNGEHFAGPGTLAAALEPNAPYLRAALPTKYHHFFDTVLMPLARMGCESLRPNASPSATNSPTKEG